MKEWIETRETYFRDERIARRRRIALDDARKLRIQALLERHRLPPIADWEIKGHRAAVAYVNEGRWIAECPVDGCNDAEFVDPEWPVFVCAGGCGSGPYAVEFPREREKIEVELVRRPAPQRRNWWPWEPVEHLALENAIKLDGASLGFLNAGRSEE